VGVLVRIALRNGITPLEVTEQLLNEAAHEIVGENIRLEISAQEIRKALDPGSFIRTRSSPGSTNPKEVKRMARDRMARWKKEKTWIEEEEVCISSAYDNLRRIAREMAHASPLKRS
jgi:hypothetical protein